MSNSDKTQAGANSGYSATPDEWRLVTQDLADSSSAAARALGADIERRLSEMQTRPHVARAFAEGRMYSFLNDFQVNLSDTEGNLLIEETRRSGREHLIERERGDE